MARLGAMMHGKAGIEHRRNRQRGEERNADQECEDGQGDCRRKPGQDMVATAAEEAADAQL